MAKRAGDGFGCSSPGEGFLPWMNDLTPQGRVEGRRREPTGPLGSVKPRLALQRRRRRRGGLLWIPRRPQLHHDPQAPGSPDVGPLPFWKHLVHPEQPSCYQRDSLPPVSTPTWQARPASAGTPPGPCPQLTRPGLAAGNRPAPTLPYRRRGHGLSPLSCNDVWA